MDVSQKVQRVLLVQMIPLNNLAIYLQLSFEVQNVLSNAICIEISERSFTNFLYKNFCAPILCLTTTFVKATYTENVSQHSEP